MWSPTIWSGCLSQCFYCHSQRKVRTKGLLFHHFYSLPQFYLFVYCFAKLVTRHIQRLLDIANHRDILTHLMGPFLNFWCQGWKLSHGELSVGVAIIAEKVLSKAEATRLVSMRKHIQLLIRILQRPWNNSQFQCFNKCCWL